MNPVADTASGKVAGSRRDGVDTFLGVPYGRAPEGRLRFQRAQEPRPWRGIRECRDFAPLAPQHVPADDGYLGVAGRAQAEDCLSLNVWTPACDDARRPVLVWLHGGAFQMGGPTSPWYDGSNLARRDVVVVSCGFRLGLLGFLDLGGLVGEPYDDAGNAGLLDVVTALRWVRDNIASFGGDPQRVTLMGQSSGAVSVCCLLAMPEAQGLFRRAVVQSGGPDAVHEPDEAQRVTAMVLESLGLRRGTAHKLLEIPVPALLDAQARVSAAHAAAQSAPSTRRHRMPFQPLADGRTVPHPLLHGLAATAGAVDVLAGTNSAEFTVIGRSSQPQPVTPQVLADRTAAIFGDPARGAAAVDVYRRSGRGEAPEQLLYAIETDHYFAIPVQRLAERYPGRLWLYQFTLDGTGMGAPFGATHGVELPFVFGNLQAPFVRRMLGPVTGLGRELSDMVMAAWLSFARDGRPAHPRLPQWPPYDLGSARHVLQFGLPPRVVEDPRAAERLVWADHTTVHALART